MLKEILLGDDFIDKVLNSYIEESTKLANDMLKDYPDDIKKLAFAFFQVAVAQELLDKYKSTPKDILKLKVFIESEEKKKAKEEGTKKI